MGEIRKHGNICYVTPPPPQKKKAPKSAGLVIAGTFVTHTRSDCVLVAIFFLPNWCHVLGSTYVF